MTEKELKTESRKQYFRYFRIYFLVFGILLILFLAVYIFRSRKAEYVRGNNKAPEERVYDYADVLSRDEEEKLREQIAKAERKIGCDIVLVTTREPVGIETYVREDTLMAMADDFYDKNNFGYDSVHGDGVLLMDNWYEGQMATWLSTCGRVYARFGSREINDVLDDVYKYIDTDPYRAYRAYVESVAEKMSDKRDFGWLSLFIFIVPAAVMFFFIPAKLKSSIGADTLRPETYVCGGKPAMREHRDRLVNQYVTRRQIPRPSGGGTRSGGSGGGGGHVSSGGVSHGGGGRSR